MKEQILENDRRIRESAGETEVGRRRMEIPGVGPLLSSAFVASIADPDIFGCGCDLAAWIGLVPKQNSSGGKERLGCCLSATRAKDQSSDHAPTRIKLSDDTINSPRNNAKRRRTLKNS